MSKKINVKKGDILYHKDDIVLCCEDSFIKEFQARIDCEIIYFKEPMDKCEEAKPFVGWRKKTSGIYFDSLYECFKDYENLGNYFKLKNKKRLIEGLSSKDFFTREFFKDIIKSQNKK